MRIACAGGRSTATSQGDALLRLHPILAAVLLAALNAHALAAEESPKAQRSKPLQRCDELKDKAQLDCLEKARERIVEARKKRETAAESKSGKESGK
jgi:hypothetical protein